MKIGIVGGAFDPPHNGHLLIAGGARDALGLERVLFIPYTVGPHKPEGARARPEHRLEMLRLAVEGEASFAVDDREIRRGGTSYTVDTLRSLREEYPGEALTLIVGSDQLALFETWKEWEVIRELAEIAVIDRPECPVEELPAELRAAAVPVRLPPIPISSTEVRERVGAGRSIRSLVPREVARYIEEHRLYREKPTVR